MLSLLAATFKVGTKLSCGCWVKIWITLFSVLESYRLENGSRTISICLICLIGRSCSVALSAVVELMCMLLISIIIWLALVPRRNSEVVLPGLLLLASDMSVSLCNRFCSELTW